MEDQTLSERAPCLSKLYLFNLFVYFLSASIAIGTFVCFKFIHQFSMSKLSYDDPDIEEQIMDGLGDEEVEKRRVTPSREIAGEEESDYVPDMSDMEEDSEEEEPKSRKDIRPGGRDMRRPRNEEMDLVHVNVAPGGPEIIDELKAVKEKLKKQQKQIKYLNRLLKKKSTSLSKKSYVSKECSVSEQSQIPGGGDTNWPVVWV